MFKSQLCKPEGRLIVFSPHGLLQQSNDPNESELLKAGITTLATAVLIYVLELPTKRDWDFFLSRQIDAQWSGYNGSFNTLHQINNVVHFTVGSNAVVKPNYERYREIVLSLNDYYRYDIQSTLMNLNIPRDSFLRFNYVSHDNSKLLLILEGD